MRTNATHADAAPVPQGGWSPALVIVLTVFALAILVAGIVAGLTVGAIIATLFLVGTGAANVLDGLTLSADAQAYRPRLGENHYVGRWLLHLLPLRLARIWTALLGCVLLAGAWYVWSINRPSPTPEAGRYTSTVSAQEPRFRFTFIVSGDKVRDQVLVWQASCASGATIATSVQLNDAPTSGWASASDFNLPMANGGIAHVHTIADTGRFLNSRVAAGVWSLSASVEQNGQTVDRCSTGTVRWTARWNGVAGPIH